MARVSVSRTYVRAAFAVIAVTSAIRVVLIARSFFWQDDYVHIWKAWNVRPQDLILQNWNGHVEIGSMAILWTMSRLWPQNWAPAAVYLITLAVLLPTLYWIALTRLAEPSPLALLSLALFAVWPALAMPQTWFSAGLQLTWLVFFFLILLLFSAPRRHAGVRGSLLMLLGYGFSERILFTVPLLIGVLLLVSSGGLSDRCRSVWNAHRGDLLVLAGTSGVIAAAVLYSAGGDEQRHVTLAVMEWVEGYAHAIVDGVIRGLSGWPVTWGDDRGTFPQLPAGWQSLALTVVMALLLAVAYRSNRQQLLVAAVVALPLLLAEPTLVLLSRSSFLQWVGPGLMTDARYLVPGSLMVLFVIGTWQGAPLPAISGYFVRTSAAVAVVGGVIGLLRILPVVDGRESRAWFHSAREAFLAPGAPPAVTTPSPPFMLGTLFYGRDAAGHQFDYGTSRTLLDVGVVRPEFNEATVVPVGPGRSGKKRLVDVDPVRSTTPLGFGSNCSVLLTEQWRKVPMTGTGLGNPILGVDLLLGRPAWIEARAQTWQQGIQLPSGFVTAWFFPPPGPFDGFQLRVSDGDGEDICVGRARAGLPTAVED